MAVPASGELSLWKIMNEVDDDDYDGGSQYTNISLSDLSDGTVDIINTAYGIGSNRPDGSVPYGMSEFYSYNHDEDYYFTFSNFVYREIFFIGLLPWLLKTKESNLGQKFFSHFFD